MTDRIIQHMTDYHAHYSYGADKNDHHHIASLITSHKKYKQQCLIRG